MSCLPYMTIRTSSLTIQTKEGRVTLDHHVIDCDVSGGVDAVVEKIQQMPQYRIIDIQQTFTGLADGIVIFRVQYEYLPLRGRIRRVYERAYDRVSGYFSSHKKEAG